MIKLEIAKLLQPQTRIYSRQCVHYISLYLYILCPSGAAPPAATVVIVVCIVVLVLIVVIGVYRIHATHQEGSRGYEEEVKEPEEDWDNSALNIIVNPMEV